MSKIIGIDLGTTNSCVSVLNAGIPIIVPNLQGNRTTPSVVSSTNSEEKIIGEIAKRQMSTNPQNTIVSIKREMGNDIEILLGKEELSPQEISSLILKNLKESAEEYIGEPVKDAIITVPAYFTDSQRQATKTAGTLAGLNVCRIINEPTAAALAYGLDKEETGIIAVYDLGGGTFDISILRLSDGIFEVLATGGNNHLGGDDFDMILSEYMRESFKQETGVDLFNDPISKYRLIEAAEKAKTELSQTKEARVNIPYITATPSGPLHLDIVITRDKLESLISPFINETIKLLTNTIDDANIKAEDIDKVILVGGSTRIPLVSSKIEETLNKSPSKNVNPDECVAMGAAIQGAIINGEIKDLLLLDVTPLSLGVETQGGLFSRVIDKNTTIPYTGHKIFSTAVDNQKEVNIKVFQGERSLAINNKLLGDFILSDIEPSPKGIPQIDVIFDIDINGIVNISAIDVKSGNKQSITISSEQKLSEDEIQNILDDAASHAAKDAEIKQKVEILNKANLTIEFANKVIQTNKDVIDDKLLEKIQTSIKELLVNISKGNLVLIDHETKELEEITSMIVVGEQDKKKNVKKQKPALKKK